MAFVIVLCYLIIGSLFTAGWLWLFNKYFITYRSELEDSIPLAAILGLFWIVTVPISLVFSPIYFVYKRLDKANESRF